MGRGAWWAAVHGVAKSRTRLNKFTFTFHFHALEKEMVTHSSVLAWRIPGTGEPGRLPSMGSHRVGHDWSDLAAAAAAVMQVLCAGLEWVPGHGAQLLLWSLDLAVQLPQPCPQRIWTSTTASLSTPVEGSPRSDISICFSQNSEQCFLQWTTWQACFNHLRPT